MRKPRYIIILTALIITLAGCSNGGDTIIPKPVDMSAASTANSHHLWGMWQFIADPLNETLDVVQLRTSDMHLNALPFLEPPANVHISLGNLEFNGNIIEIDIGLRHPFLGLTEFSGFDVCGVFITNGSISGFDDPGLVMAGDGETRLLNPDGLTRWWNPSEFPVNTGTMFAYNDGLLGAPDSFADFNCTLNGCKYFTDALDPDAPVGSLPADNDGMFSPGQKNIRHYTIELGTEGLIFNYAIDACWAFPEGVPPWTAPDDFPEKAWRVEAWNIVVTEIANTLWNDGLSSGGDLSLSIDIWDHFNADLNTVKVESPGNFIPTESSVATSGGDGYSTYEVDIVDAAPSASGEIELLISVECEDEDYQGLLAGETVTAYFPYSTTVADESPIPQYHLEWDSETIINSNQPLWDDISPALAAETDNQTVVAWNCDNNTAGSPAHYQNFSRSSNGLIWPDGTNCFPGGSHKGDQVKCAAGTNGTSFSTFATVFSSGDPPFNPYGTRNEDYNFGGNYCFPRHDIWSSIEMFVSQTGRVFVFTDYNYYSSTAGVIDAQHSNGPNTLDGGVSWWGYQDFPVTTGGLISHSRSIGDTSDGTMYLVYYAQVGSAIMMVSSTDGSTGEAWGTPVTVVNDTLYNNYIDPSISIESDGTFYISYQCRTDSDDSYNIFVVETDSTGVPTGSPLLVHNSISAIEQPAIDVMQYPGGDAIFVSWVEGNTVYLGHSLDGATFEAPITVQETYSPSKQADCIVDHQGNLQVVWSGMDGADWDIIIRRARLVEN